MSSKEVVTKMEQGGSDMSISSDPMVMISKAIGSGLDENQLKMLMDLQERHQNNMAKVAFNKDMSLFTKEMPTIVKDARVTYKTAKGLTDYSHVTLANVVKHVNPGMAKNNLSFGWRTSQNNGSITVSCVVTHADGHSIDTSLTAPADPSGGKNSVQAIGSTISYLQRYTLLSILGVAVFEDDDAVSVGDKVDLISQDKVNTIHSLIEETTSNVIIYLQVLSDSFGVTIKTVEDIPDKYFLSSVAMLEKKKKSKLS